MKYNILFFFCLLLTLSCSDAHKQNNKLEGIYKLVSLQAQDDTVFAPMEGVEILKVFTGNQWMSPAYLSRSKKVVHTAGGTFTYKDGEYTEVLAYHSKDTLHIGEVSTYKVKLMNDTLYQSGFYKKGTDEEWKIEEYWIRVR